MKLNCDLGEGFDELDAQLMPHLHQASVACGGHAGDAHSMARCVALAAQHGVTLGAHPSYPDRQHFGRRSLRLANDPLLAELHTQVTALAEIAKAKGQPLRFIKPHGALYNDCVTQPERRRCLLRLAEQWQLPLVLQALPEGDAFADYHRDLASATRGWLGEAFADRGYGADGRLLPRGQAGAVLTTEEALAQVRQLIDTGWLKGQHGQTLAVNADILCVHSDSPGALPLVVALRTLLDTH